MVISTNKTGDLVFLQKMMLFIKYKIDTQQKPDFYNIEEIGANNLLN